MTERFMMLECNDGGRQFDQKYFIYQLPVHTFICQILNNCTYQTKKKGRKEIDGISKPTLRATYPT